MEVFTMVTVVAVAGIVAGSASTMYKSYVKNKAAERKQQAASLPAEVQERLTRLETRLAEMSEGQRQLRSELEWQGKLLQSSGK